MPNTTQVLENVFFAFYDNVASGSCALFSTMSFLCSLLFTIITYGSFVFYDIVASGFFAFNDNDTSALLRYTKTNHFNINVHPFHTSV